MSLGRQLIAEVDAGHMVDPVVVLAKLAVARRDLAAVRVEPQARVHAGHVVWDVVSGAFVAITAGKFSAVIHSRASRGLQRLDSRGTDGIDGMDGSTSTGGWPPGRWRARTEGRGGERSDEREQGDHGGGNGAACHVVCLAMRKEHGQDVEIV